MTELQLVNAQLMFNYRLQFNYRKTLLKFKTYAMKE